MAELVYHVSTDWQEVERLFNEITKLNAALDKVNTDAPRVEVERLIGKISELKEKYNEIISVSQQANNDITQAFKDTSSSDNPLKGLGENADKTAKTLKDSFDSVIGKVCELYDYIEEVKKSINSLNSSSDIIGNMGNKMEALSAAVERQELSLSNQSAQNANILQQQQAELMAQNQQNTQMQSLNETASERVSIENEVASTIEDTTTIIEGQTEAVKEHTEAIKEQNEATQEVGDEFSDAVLSEERAITEKINSLKEFNSRIQESLANVASQQEKENLEKQYSENEAQIQSLESQLENLTSVNEKTAESANAVFNIYKQFDEAGQPFRVMAQTAEEATEKIEFAKRILEIYPEVMKSISEKADDMRLNAYMTDEGEQLVKEAQRIAEKLSSKGSVSQMFGGNGENQGEQLLEQLQNIDSTLDNIKAKEQAIEQEREKSDELARIQAEEAEKRALSSQTMRTQMMKAREEMIQMIAAGKQGTPEFMALAQKAGEMRRQLAEANAYMQYLSTPQRGLAALKTGLQGVAGTASLVTSTIGLFNKDSKKMVEIQTKVQSILGIIVGLETTYNLVKRESFVRMALEEVRIWAIAKARGAQAAATMAAAGAQETLNKAMLKNPYGAIIALLVTLVTTIWAVTKALTRETEAEKKAREEKEAHIKAIKEQQEKWAQSVAESASKQIESYKKLQKKWNELGNDMAKKKKFVKDNQTAFHNLGLSINGVSDAENVLVKNTDAVVDSIMARAKALAYQELMTDSYKKQIEEQMKADQKNTSVKGGQFSYQVKAGGNATNKKNLAYKNAYAAGYRYMEGDTEDGKWTEQGARRLNQYSSNYAAQQRAKAAEEDKKRNKKYEDEQKKLQDKANKELENEKKKLADAGIKTYDPMTDKKDKEKKEKGKTAAEKAQEQRELMDKQKREQKRAAEDLEFSTREARIKAMEESTEKVLAQIELDHDREVKAIERAYEDMRVKRVEAAKQLWEKDDKNKGKNFFESQEYLNALTNPNRKTLSKDDSVLKDVQEQEKRIIAELGKGEIMNAIQEQFGKGNVDILARPLIDTIELAKKGWQDVGEGYATVFSSGFGVEDKNGKVHEILITPILPDGSVLSEKELNDYVNNVLNGAEDILAADEKGVVIAVDVDKDAGEKLHILQEQLYDIPEEKTIEIKTLYDKALDSEVENREVRLEAAAKQRQQALKEENDRQIQALLDYQKAYGDFQTQREAITKEYDLKIDKEQDTIQKAALARQKERLISELNMKELQQSLDWETVFNNLEYQSVEALQSLKKQLSVALDAKDITAENAKVLAEKIREIEDSIARKTDIWSSWIPGLRERKRLTLEVLEVEKQIQGLTTARNTAGVSQDKAISKFTSAVGVSEGAFRQEWQQINKGNLEDIKDRYKNEVEASEEVKKAFEVLETTTIDLAKSEENLTQTQKDYQTRQDALKNFTKGGSIGQYFKDVTAGMDKASIFGLINQNAQSANSLIGNIGLGNTEFGKGFAEFAEGMQGFQNGIQSLMQGDVFGAINGMVDGIQGFGDVIGRAFGINWTGGNEKAVAETTERLTKQNKELTRSIDELTEQLGNSYGGKALSVYQKALEAQEKVNKNQMEILEAQMGYHSAHHSNAYYADDKKIASYNKQAQEAMRTAGVQVSTITGLESIYNLTPEQLKAIRDFAPDLWRYLTEVGEYDKSEYWDAVVEQAGKTKELTEQIMEIMTTTTNESVFSQFLSQLKELANGADDVFSNIAKDWQDMVNEMIVNNFIGDAYQEKLEEWRKKIYDLNKKYKEGGMSMQEYKKGLADLEAEYRSYVNEAKKEINEYKEAGIITNPEEKAQQTATGKSIQNISYNQADSLVGIATAQQIAQEQSRDRLDMLNVKADQVYMLAIESRDIAADSRQILAGMAIHVEEIRDGVVDTVVPAIKDMRSDLAKVRKLVEEQ